MTQSFPTMQDVLEASLPKHEHCTCVEPLVAETARLSKARDDAVYGQMYLSDQLNYFDWEDDFKKLPRHSITLGTINDIRARWKLTWSSVWHDNLSRISIGWHNPYNDTDLALYNLTHGIVGLIGVILQIIVGGSLIALLIGLLYMRAAVEWIYERPLRPLYDLQEHLRNIWKNK